MKSKKAKKVKKKYMDITRKYLRGLNEKINSIDSIYVNIEELKKQEKYYELNYDCISTGANTTYKGIDDLIIRVKDKIYIEEGKIEHIQNKYKKLEIFLNKYKDSEKEVIIHKYFTKKDDNSQYTNPELANKLNYSLATVKRIDKKIISDIAIDRYGDEAIEEENIA